MSKYRIWMLLILFVSTFLGIWTWPDSKLHVVFCDVGQGDAALIRLGSWQALVDTGSDIAKFDACLAKYLPWWDRKIELVFISHDQKDHSGALKELRSRYVLEMVADKIRSGDILRTANIEFDVLSGGEARDKVGGQENNDSLVIKMRFGEFEILFTGDIDSQAELALVNSGVLKQMDVLKVSHHGSKFGSSALWLEKIMPKIAVVSVGANNTYGHPNGDTLLRLDIVGAKVFRTDKNGNVEVVTDGKVLGVRTEKK